MAQMILGGKMFCPDSKTAIGALPNYISDESIENLQPMNANFGIIESLDRRVKNKVERYNQIAIRALDRLKEQLSEYDERG